MARMRAESVRAIRSWAVRSAGCFRVCVGVLILLVALIVQNVQAGPGDKKARQGVEQFKRENFAEALATFEEAATLDPTSGRIQYNLGTMFGQVGRHAEAATTLDHALNFDDLLSRRDAFYNLGFSRVRDAMAEGETPKPPQLILEEMRGGLSAFREALIADPSDADAKHNYEVTRELIRRLEEQARQENQQQGNQQGDQQQDQQSEDQQQEEGEQSEEESEEGSTEPDNEGSSDEERSSEQQSQESGLEATPTPTPTPSPGTQAEPPESTSEIEPDTPPSLTPEQLDALRVLNSLEQENPEQFRRLFNFRGNAKSRGRKQDW